VIMLLIRARSSEAVAVGSAKSSLRTLEALESVAIAAAMELIAGSVAIGANIEEAAWSIAED
jgi:hypothetical protein